MANGNGNGIGDIFMYRFGGIGLGVTAVFGAVAGVYIITKGAKYFSLVGQRNRRQDNRLTPSSSSCAVCKKPLSNAESHIATCSVCNQLICVDTSCAIWIEDSSQWECFRCNSTNNVHVSASDWFIQKLTDRIGLDHVEGIMNEIQVTDQKSHHSPFSIEQREKARDLVEELVGDIVNGPVDNVTVAQITNNATYLPEYENYERSDEDHSNLKKIVQLVVEEVMKLPSILNQTGISDRPEERLPYFDPKKYEQLLATAVLNKIVESYNYEDRYRSPADLARNNELMRRKSPSPTSSVEPISDNSGNEAIIKKGKPKRNSDSSPLSSGESPEEAYLSDYLQKHKIPLPNLSDEIADDNEDLNSEWQDNWSFRRKNSTDEKNKKMAPYVSVLLPTPKDAIYAQIGDKNADEISDLSEIDDVEIEEPLDFSSYKSTEKRSSLLNNDNNEKDDQLDTGIFEPTSLISHNSTNGNDKDISEARNIYLFRPSDIEPELQSLTNDNATSYPYDSGIINPLIMSIADKVMGEENNNEVTRKIKSTEESISIGTAASKRDDSDSQNDRMGMDGTDAKNVIRSVSQFNSMTDRVDNVSSDTPVPMPRKLSKCSADSLDVSNMSSPISLDELNVSSPPLPDLVTEYNNIPNVQEPNTVGVHMDSDADIQSINLEGVLETRNMIKNSIPMSMTTPLIVATAMIEHIFDINANESNPLASHNIDGNNQDECAVSRKYSDTETPSVDIIKETLSNLEPISTSELHIHVPLSEPESLNKITQPSIGHQPLAPIREELHTIRSNSNLPPNMERPLVAISSEDLIHPHHTNLTNTDRTLRKPNNDFKSEIGVQKKDEMICLLPSAHNNSLASKNANREKNGELPYDNLENDMRLQPEATQNIQTYNHRSLMSMHAGQPSGGEQSVPINLSQASHDDRFELDLQAARIGELITEEEVEENCRIELGDDAKGVDDRPYATFNCVMLNEARPMERPVEQRTMPLKRVTNSDLNQSEQILNAILHADNKIGSQGGYHPRILTVQENVSETIEILPRNVMDDLIHLNEDMKKRTTTDKEIDSILHSKDTVPGEITLDFNTLSTKTSEEEGAYAVVVNNICASNCTSMAANSIVTEADLIDDKDQDSNDQFKGCNSARINIRKSSQYPSGENKTPSTFHQSKPSQSVHTHNQSPDMNSEKSINSSMNQSVNNVDDQISTEICKNPTVDEIVPTTSMYVFNTQVTPAFMHQRKELSFKKNIDSKSSTQTDVLSTLPVKVTSKPISQHPIKSSTTPLKVESSGKQICTVSNKKLKDCVMHSTAKSKKDLRNIGSNSLQSGKSQSRPTIKPGESRVGGRLPESMKSRIRTTRPPETPKVPKKIDVSTLQSRFQPKPKPNTRVPMQSSRSKTFDNFHKENKYSMGNCPKRIESYRKSVDPKPVSTMRNRFDSSPYHNSNELKSRFGPYSPSSVTKSNTKSVGLSDNSPQLKRSTTPKSDNSRTNPFDRKSCTTPHQLQSCHGRSKAPSSDLLQIDLKYKPKTPTCKVVSSKSNQNRHVSSPNMQSVVQKRKYPEKKQDDYIEISTVTKRPCSHSNTSHSPHQRSAYQRYYQQRLCPIFNKTDTTQKSKTSTEESKEQKKKDKSETSSHSVDQKVSIVKENKGLSEEEKKVEQPLSAAVNNAEKATKEPEKSEVSNAEIAKSDGKKGGLLSSDGSDDEKPRPEKEESTEKELPEDRQNITPVSRGNNIYHQHTQSSQTPGMDVHGNKTKWSQNNHVYHCTHKHHHHHQFKPLADPVGNADNTVKTSMPSIEDGTNVIYVNESPEDDDMRMHVDSANLNILDTTDSDVKQTLTEAAFKLADMQENIESWRQQNDGHYHHYHHLSHYCQHCMTSTMPGNNMGHVDYREDTGTIDLNEKHNRFPRVEMQAFVENTRTDHQNIPTYYRHIIQQPDNHTTDSHVHHYKLDRMVPHVTKPHDDKQQNTEHHHRSVSASKDKEKLQSADEQSTTKNSVLHKDPKEHKELDKPVTNDKIKDHHHNRKTDDLRLSPEQHSHRRKEINLNNVCLLSATRRHSSSDGTRSHCSSDRKSHEPKSGRIEKDEHNHHLHDKDKQVDQQHHHHHHHHQSRPPNEVDHEKLGDNKYCARKAKNSRSGDLNSNNSANHRHHSSHSHSKRHEPTHSNNASIGDRSRTSNDKSDKSRPCNLVYDPTRGTHTTSRDERDHHHHHSSVHQSKEHHSKEHHSKEHYSKDHHLKEHHSPDQQTKEHHSRDHHLKQHHSKGHHLKDEQTSVHHSEDQCKNAHHPKLHHSKDHHQVNHHHIDLHIKDYHSKDQHSAHHHHSRDNYSMSMLDKPVTDHVIVGKLYFNRQSENTQTTKDNTEYFSYSTKQPKPNEHEIGTLEQSPVQSNSVDNSTEMPSVIDTENNTEKPEDNKSQIVEDLDQIEEPELPKELKDDEMKMTGESKIESVLRHQCVHSVYHQKSVQPTLPYPELIDQEASIIRLEENAILLATHSTLMNQQDQDEMLREMLNMKTNDAINKLMEQKLLYAHKEQNEDNKAVNSDEIASIEQNTSSIGDASEKKLEEARIIDTDNNDDSILESNDSNQQSMNSDWEKKETDSTSSPHKVHLHHIHHIDSHQLHHLKHHENTSDDHIDKLDLNQRKDSNKDTDDNQLAVHIEVEPQTDDEKQPDCLQLHSHHRNSHHHAHHKGVLKSEPQLEVNKSSANEKPANVELDEQNPTKTPPNHHCHCIHGGLKMDDHSRNSIQKTTSCPCPTESQKYEMYHCSEESKSSADLDQHNKDKDSQRLVPITEHHSLDETVHRQHHPELIVPNQVYVNKPPVEHLKELAKVVADKRTNDVKTVVTCDESFTPLSQHQVHVIQGKHHKDYHAEVLKEKERLESSAEKMLNEKLANTGQKNQSHIPHGYHHRHHHLTHETNVKRDHEHQKFLTEMNEQNKRMTEHHQSKVDDINVPEEMIKNSDQVNNNTSKEEKCKELDSNEENPLNESDIIDSNKSAEHKLDDPKSNEVNENFQPPVDQTVKAEADDRSNEKNKQLSNDSEYHKCFFESSSINVLEPTVLQGESNNPVKGDEAQHVTSIENNDAEATAPDTDKINDENTKAVLEENLEEPQTEEALKKELPEISAQSRHTDLQAIDLEKYEKLVEGLTAAPDDCETKELKTNTPPIQKIFGILYHHYATPPKSHIHNPYHHINHQHIGGIKCKRNETILEIPSSSDIRVGEKLVDIIDREARCAIDKSVKSHDQPNQTDIIDGICEKDEKLSEEADGKLKASDKLVHDALVHDKKAEASTSERPVISDQTTQFGKHHHDMSKVVYNMTLLEQPLGFIDTMGRGKSEGKELDTVGMEVNKALTHETLPTVSITKPVDIPKSILKGHETEKQQSNAERAEEAAKEKKNHHVQYAKLPVLRHASPRSDRCHHWSYHHHNNMGNNENCMHMMAQSNQMKCKMDANAIMRASYMGKKMDHHHLMFSKNRYQNFQMMMEMRKHEFKLPTILSENRQIMPSSTTEIAHDSPTPSHQASHQSSELRVASPIRSDFGANNNKLQKTQSCNDTDILLDQKNTVVLSEVDVNETIPSAEKEMTIRKVCSEDNQMFHLEKSAFVAEPEKLTLDATINTDDIDETEITENCQILSKPKRIVEKQNTAINCELDHANRYQKMANMTTSTTEIDEMEEAYDALSSIDNCSDNNVNDRDIESLYDGIESNTIASTAENHATITPTPELIPITSENELVVYNDIDATMKEVKSILEIEIAKSSLQDALPIGQFHDDVLSDVGESLHPNSLANSAHKLDDIDFDDCKKASENTIVVGNIATIDGNGSMTVHKLEQDVITNQQSLKQLNKDEFDLFTKILPYPNRLNESTDPLPETTEDTVTAKPEDCTKSGIITKPPEIDNVSSILLKMNVNQEQPTASSVDLDDFSLVENKFDDELIGSILESNTSHGETIPLLETCNSIIEMVRYKSNDEDHSSTGSESNDETKPVRHDDSFSSGSIAEREHKKWLNAVQLTNNPYSPEVLEKRLSSPLNKSIIDIEKLSTPKEDNCTKVELAESSLDEDSVSLLSDKSHQISVGVRKPDQNRYGRDYYINDTERTNGTPKNKRNSGSYLASKAILNSSDEDRCGTKLTVLNQSPTNEFYTVESSAGTDTVFLAKPIRIDPELDIKCDTNGPTAKRSGSFIELSDELNLSHSSSFNDSTRFSRLSPGSPVGVTGHSDSITSEDSDVTRVYNLNSGEKRIIHSESVLSDVPSPDLNKLRNIFEPLSRTNSVSPTRVRKSILNMEKTENEIKEATSPVQPTVTVESETVINVPPVNQQNGVADTESINDLTMTTKSVIEDDVIPSLPSVKELAKSFLKSNDTNQPSTVHKPKATVWLKPKEETSATMNSDSEQIASSRDSYVPPYEDKYHPISVGHSITARNVSQQLLNDLKTNDETTEPSLVPIDVEPAQIQVDEDIVDTAADLPAEPCVENHNNVVEEDINVVTNNDTMIVEDNMNQMSIRDNDDEPVIENNNVECGAVDVDQEVEKTMSGSTVVNNVIAMNGAKVVETPVERPISPVLVPGTLAKTRQFFESLSAKSS